MPTTPALTHAARTLQGRRRLSNQDRFVVDDELGFVLLADGVAGRPAGARAAEVAIAAASTQLGLGLGLGAPSLPHAVTVMRDAFRLANLAVRRTAELDETLANMASTLVGAAFLEGHAIIGSLGDSRVYRLRHAFLEQVTLDHVRPVADLAQLSPTDAAAVRPLVQVLTRAVGHRKDVEPDVTVEPLCAGDIFLFCSNGLSDSLETKRIGELLALCDTLDAACERLLRAAMATGAADDVTFVVARPQIAATGGR